MKNAIASALRKLRKSAKGRQTAFVIGNTSDRFARGRYYETPLRETPELIYSGVIVRDVATAQAIARMVDGKVDYMLVDDEKKIRKIYYGPNDVGNIEKEVRAIVRASALLTYKGNDLAVEAVDVLLGNIIKDIGGSRIAVLGMGNLGSKIALRLVERGAHVAGYRRDRKKLAAIVHGLNRIKSEDTMAAVTASRSADAACRDATIIIGATNEKSVITKQMLAAAAPGTVLIDAGKGCFAAEVTDDPAFLVYRVDVSIVQRYAFSGLITAHAYFGKGLGRRVIPEIDITLISIGLSGRKGEVIVDDIHAPTRIIGIAAGDGTLAKESPQVKKQLATLTRYIRTH